MTLEELEARHAEIADKIAHKELHNFPAEVCRHADALLALCREQRAELERMRQGILFIADELYSNADDPTSNVLELAEMLLLEHEPSA